MITRGETDHVILHVILTSLHQENGYSFPDHLPNGSNYFVEVGRVWDYTLLVVIIGCFSFLPLCVFSSSSQLGIHETWQKAVSIMHSFICMQSSDIVMHWLCGCCLIFTAFFLIPPQAVSPSLYSHPNHVCSVRCSLLTTLLAPLFTTWNGWASPHFTDIACDVLVA